jgi:hypothetical protein
MLQLSATRVVRPQTARVPATRRAAATCSLRDGAARVGSALTTAALAVTLAASPALAKAADFGVYWVSPANNTTSTSPVAVKFGVKGLDVKPAGAFALSGPKEHVQLLCGARAAASGVSERRQRCTTLGGGRGVTWLRALRAWLSCRGSGGGPGAKRRARARAPPLCRAAEGLQEGTGHHHVIVDGQFLKARARAAAGQRAAHKPNCFACRA